MKLYLKLYLDKRLMIDQGTFEYTSKFIRSLVEREERFDGRKLNEYRTIKIIPNYIKNAEGSCYVELGNTKVITGIKLEVDKPFPDTPNKGIFIVSLEFLPSSFPTVEAGPPGPEAIEIARVIDKIIRESRFIDLENMVIEEGQHVWLAFIDIYVMNDDGNIVDAGMLSTLGALLTTRLPELVENNGEYSVNPEIKTNKKLPLNMNNIPSSVSFAKIGNKYVVDPIKLEEESAELLIHIGLADKNIHGLQTRKSGTITENEFLDLVNISEDMHKKIKKILLNSVK